MEAPPGFEPGMEVLQCSALGKNKGKLANFIEVFASDLVGVGLVLADPGSVLGTVLGTVTAPPTPPHIQDSAPAAPQPV